MKKAMMILYVLLFVLLFSCAYEEPEEPIETIPLSLDEEQVVEYTDRKQLKEDRANFFTFAPPQAATYRFSLRKQTIDYDLTLGLFEENTELKELPVYYVSKNIGLLDEVIEAELIPETTYLIEVWNYADALGSCVLTVETVAE